MATTATTNNDADAPRPRPPPPHHLEQLPRVLSIQSHVASGRVGNCAALFPLMLHRFDCDAINTVSFSNHTGYPSVAGSRLSAEGLSDLLGGLERNGFLRASRGRRGYDYVLTGYVGRADTLAGIKGAIEGMVKVEEEGSKRSRRRPLVVVDPVMGDHDRARAGSSSSSSSSPSTLFSSLYVPEDVPAVYRSLLPLADVITPNAFEAEMLLLTEGEEGRGDSGGCGDGDEGNDSTSEKKIKRRREFEIVDEASAVAACAALHSRGPQIVVLTSVAFPAAAAAAAGAASAAPSRTLTLYASQCRRESDSEESIIGSSRRFPAPPAGATPANPAVWRLELPRIDAPFTGTGDLLTALLLSFLHEAGGGEKEGGKEKETKGGGGAGGESRDLGWALERAAAGVRAVVDATVSGAAAEAARAAAELGEEEEGEEEEAEEEGSKEGNEKKKAVAALSSDYWASPRAVAARELRLVQCADALVAPQVVARSERIQ